MLVVAPAVGLLGMAIQRLVIQPLTAEPNMQIFATFGLLIFFQNTMLVLTRGQAYSIGNSASNAVVELGDLKLSAVRVVTLVATTVITIGLHLFLARTMTGKSIRAVTQDKRAARTMGINVERTYLLTFGIGAALAGMAGAMLRLLHDHICLADDFGFNLFLQRADHDHCAGRIEYCQAVGQVAQHRFAGDGVQHLVASRFHARAHAGGKNDGGKGGSGHHISSPAITAGG